MSSWKLVGAAIKAQRTWANLSPEQKAQVRNAASQAAKNAYARMQDTPPQPKAPQQAEDAPPAAAAQREGAPAQEGVPPQEGAPEQEDAPPRDQTPAASAAAALAGLARAHGPRLARQAATQAAIRSQGRAGQLVALWRRAQRPPPSK